MSNLGTFSGGGTPSSSNEKFWNGNIPWISSSNLEEDNILKINVSRFITQDAIEKSSTKLCKAPSVLIVSRVGVGKVALSLNDVCTSQDFTNISELKCNQLYLAFQLSKVMKKAANEVQGTSIKGISSSEIKSKKICLPPIIEQEKISSFFERIEERIQTQKKIIEGLSLQKISIVKKLFENKIKFKTDNETQNWERKKLAEISEEHLHKNPDNKYNEVFSVAKHKGVINQIEHLGRAFSAKEILHYKLVYPGDLVYTKSPTSDFPLGIIKQNRTGRIGVVSPLYCVFTPKTYALGYLLHEYFNSSVNTFNYLNPLVQKGAKNTMNINNETFLNGTSILLPMNEEEQKKIYKFLLSLDEKINLENELLTQYENQKKYLLQNLFV
ncbi:hypothetical protein DRF67_17945 [Chryseobacterium pennipullorum]|uniref:Type I restriction modification DNA specificity domain-containing protein n=1 Tax=Chryseobacterium pennipullorum TaxID=2258963 RepID=A0A3D9ASZ2_9FLAO|nr:hypothetical protein DRF67_17945 [Chryseobacterium pennipullorum]